MDKVTTFRTSLILCLLLFLIAGFLPQLSAQSPDRCQNAQFIQCGDVISGSTVGATSDLAPACNFLHDSPGVWFTFIGSNRYVTLSTCGAADFDTRITVFEGDCGTLSCKAWNNDSPVCGDTTSEVTFVADAGIQYFVLINGHNNTFGNFTLSMNCTAPLAPNDRCTGALPLTCGDQIIGTTTNSTPDPTFVSPTPINSRGVWYYFEGNGAPVTLSTCSPTTNFDTKLTVLSGSCGAFQLVTQNEDACGNQAEAFFDSQPGRIYYILVHGNNQEYGDFQLTLSCPPPPVNDEPCNAQALLYGLNPFSNIHARRDPNEVCPGPGSGVTCHAQDGWCVFNTRVECSVWFTFIAPPSGSVNIVTDSFDTQIALYRVNNCLDYTSFKQIAANDDSGRQLNPSVAGTAAGLIEVSCLEPGQTYYLQVDGFNGMEGNGTIELIDVGTPPLSLDLGGCQSRFTGYRPAERDTNFLVAEASGGRSPYHYEWNQVSSILYMSSDSSSLAVQPQVSTIYTCTVEDSRGCRVTEQVKVEVVDVSCISNRGPGITLCHTRLNGSSRSICVPVRQARQLLRQPGYSLGPCNLACNEYNPSFPPPPACTNFDITLNTDGFGIDIGWELTDVLTGNVIGARSTGDLNGFRTYNYRYCLDPTRCYAFKITDVMGDGMCCNFGSGSYSIAFDGTTYTSPTGGSFGYEETLQIGACNQGTSSKQDEHQEASEKARAKINLEAFPNPFSASATIRFQLIETGLATLELYNASGQKISTLYNGTAEAGLLYEAQLQSRGLNNGFYFYRLTTETGEAQSGKILLSK